MSCVTNLCPLHKNTGFTLTLLDVIRILGKSKKKFGESETFSESRFDPATGVSCKIGTTAKQEPHRHGPNGVNP